MAAASDKITPGGNADFIIDNTGAMMSAASYVELKAVGAVNTIATFLTTEGNSMLITSGGNLMTFSEWKKYADGGGVDTIQTILAGAGADMIVTATGHKSLVEMEAGNVQIFTDGADGDIADTLPIL